MISNGIGVFDNAVSPTTCNNLIAVYEKRMSLNRPTVLRNEENVRDLSQFYARDSYDTDGAWADCLISSDDTVMFDDIVASFWRNCYAPYAEAYPILNSIGRHSLGYMKIQKTQPAGGYHIFHCEQSRASSSRRLGFFILYLNTVQEGGETEFLYQSQRVQAVQGRMVIAPSSFTHTHRGNPPLAGDKYIVTGWLEFQE